MDSASSSAPELEDDLDPEPPEDGGERGAPRGPLPVGGWQYAEAPQPPPRVPFVVPRDVVTRMLCSTVHLKGAFADHVLDNLVDPTHRAMLLTPISPHSLFDRSLVLDPASEVEVAILGDRPAAVSVDGEEVAVLEPGSRVTVAPSATAARLVTFGGRDFHQILKAKFGLSDR